MSNQGTHFICFVNSSVPSLAYDGGCIPYPMGRQRKNQTPEIALWCIPWIKPLPLAFTGMSPFQWCLGYQPPPPKQEEKRDVPPAQFFLHCCKQTWSWAWRTLLHSAKTYKGQADRQRWRPLCIISVKGKWLILGTIWPFIITKRHPSPSLSCSPTTCGRSIPHFMSLSLIALYPARKYSTCQGQ